MRLQKSQTWPNGWAHTRGVITSHLPALNTHFFPQTLTTLIVCVCAHVTKCTSGGRFCYSMRRRLFFRQCTYDRMLVERSSNQITSLQTSVPHLKTCAVHMPWCRWWLVLPSVCLCVCAQSLQSCLTPCDPMDCNPPGSSVHGILQGRVLEWVAKPSSRESFQPRNQTHASCISCTAGKFFTAEPLVKLGPQAPVVAKCWAPSFQEAKRRGDSRQQEITPVVFSPGSRATEG